MSLHSSHAMKENFCTTTYPEPAAAAAAVKSVQLAEEEKICSCQVRFMSGPDHYYCDVVVLPSTGLAAHMHTWARNSVVDTSEVNVS